MKASKLIELLQLEVSRVGDQNIRISLDVNGIMVDPETSETSENIQVGYEDTEDGLVHCIVITNY